MKFGIYIHIPFCQTRCNYCHFVTRPWHSATADRYAGAVESEIVRYFSADSPLGFCGSIYFGGGTPSIVPVEHIRKIANACRNGISLADDCEITLEANPGSLSKEKAESYRRFGINRISLGAQSFVDGELAAIGRDHTGDEVDESVALLREAGITNVSLDLMLGLPGQTEVQWRGNLERVIELEPNHISIYMLDLDAKSPLYHEIRRGRSKVPEDDLVADLYLYSIDFLESHGYRQYEISNFSLPGFQSRHNLGYWDCEPVLGFGVGSHSFDGRSRYANQSAMAGYLEQVEAGRSPIDWTETRSARQILEERLFMGLRLNRGIDWNVLRQEHDQAVLSGYESTLRKMAERGLLQWDDAVLHLTRRGMLLSNEIFQELV